MTKTPTKSKSNGKQTETDIEFFQKAVGNRYLEPVKSFISTGCTLLDYAIANKPNGGVPVGRITEIVGNEASGKSLITYHILANTQKKGGIAVYIDTERAADREFMERMGIDFDSLVLPQPPDTIEGVFDMVEQLAKLARTKYPEKSKPVTIVWDSIAASNAMEEEEKDHSATRKIGAEAQAMSRSLRKVINVIDKGYITLVCVNQLRSKIGASWGSNDITPHGKALPFYASCRIKLKSLKQIKDSNTETIGVHTQSEVFKNKVAPNHRKTLFPIMYDWGVDNEASWITWLADEGIVKKNKAWYSFIFDDKEYNFQGTSKWKEILKEKGVRDFILKEIEKKLVRVFDKPPEVEVHDAITEIVN